MREIKFRAFAHASKTMFYPDSEAGWELHFGSINALPNTTLMQFTGLYDNSPVHKDVYEGDVMDDNGCVITNIYESPQIHEEGAYHVIESMGTEAWRNTESVAMGRGCKYAQ